MPSKMRCQNAPVTLILFLFSILEKNKLDELNKRFHVKGTEGKSLVPQLIKTILGFFCKLVCIIDTRQTPALV